MAADDIQTHGCKYPRISNGNGRIESSKIGKKGDEQYADEEDGEPRRGRQAANAGGCFGGGIDFGGGVGRFNGWPTSRIVRVSRASGGKDRHSKVLTSKGLRDRRVRLSVNTAIQFYDLQDRLGYDQPSKAVEWLLKAAAGSISELPSISTAFPDTPQQPSDEKRSSSGAGNDQQAGFDSDEVDMDGGDPQQMAAILSKSSGGKGSGLSLSRSVNRIKARERAKERVAEKEKEKEKENESPHNIEHLNPLSQTTSFTELLSVGMNSVNNATNLNSSVHQHAGSEPNFFQKSSRQWSSSSMDYFTGGLLGTQGTRPGQIHLGNTLSTSVSSSPLFSISGHRQPELQHISFASENFVPVNVTSACGNHTNNNDSTNNHNNGRDEYNLNFTMSSSHANSSGLAGFNRGTLQSNSSSTSFLSQLHRFPPIDGSPPNFFIGTTMPAAAPVENHHQFMAGFDAGLQLCYGDGGGHPQKGKRKT